MQSLKYILPPLEAGRCAPGEVLVDYRGCLDQKYLAVPPRCHPYGKFPHGRSASGPIPPCKEDFPQIFFELNPSRFQAVIQFRASSKQATGCLSPIGFVIQFLSNCLPIAHGQRSPASNLLSPAQFSPPGKKGLVLKKRVIVAW